MDDVDPSTRRSDVSAVVAGCEDRNVPSVRTLERAGFVRTDEVDGQIRWRFGGPRS